LFRLPVTQALSLQKDSNVPFLLITNQLSSRPFVQKKGGEGAGPEHVIHPYN